MCAKPASSRLKGVGAGKWERNSGECSIDLRAGRVSLLPSHHCESENNGIPESLVRPCGAIARQDPFDDRPFECQDPISHTFLLCSHRSWIGSARDEVARYPGWWRRRLGDQCHGRTSNLRHPPCGHLDQSLQHCEYTEPFPMSFPDLSSRQIVKTRTSTTRRSCTIALTLGMPVTTPSEAPSSSTNATAVQPSMHSGAARAQLTSMKRKAHRRTTALAATGAPSLPGRMAALIRRTEKT